MSIGLFDLVRKQRVLEVFGNPQESNATVFLGLFNAAGFWGQVEHNILSQKRLTETRVVIVDNASADSTWDLARGLASKLPNGAVLVRNPVNIGGSGSLYANLDLFENDWFISLHQDDVYFEDHISKHLDLIKKAGEDVAIVTTEMAHLKTKGGIGSSPRGSWFLADRSSMDLYLAHLKFHVAPFPAASFRVKALSETMPTFHNTSFPDTEIVLQLLSRWNIEIHDVTTMAYRENPLSESHILRDREIEYGQFMALLKHFGGQDFEKFALSLSVTDRETFAKNALNSIKTRFASEAQLQVLSDFFLERLIQIWGYSSKFVSSQLALTYSRMNSQFATDFITLAQSSIENLTLPDIKLEQLINWQFVAGKSPNKAARAMLVAAARAVSLLLNTFGIRQDINFRWKK